MNYSFENKIDNSYFKEFHSSRKTVKMPVLLITFFLSLLFIILNAFNEKNNDLAFISAMFAAAFGLFLLVKMPFYITDKNMLKKHTENLLKEVVTINEDHIHILTKLVNNEENEVNVKYEDIVSFTELENLIIMTCVLGHVYLISKKSLNNIPALAHLKNKCFGKIKFNEYSEKAINSYHKDKEEKFNDSHNITYRYDEKCLNYQKKILLKQYLFIDLSFLFLFALFLVLQIILKTAAFLPCTVFSGIFALVYTLFTINFFKGKNMQHYYFNYISDMKIDENNIFVTTYANDSVYKSLYNYNNVISITVFNDDIVIMLNGKKYFYINKEFYNEEFLSNLQKYYNKK